jgi:hypothetical protein
LAGDYLVTQDATPVGVESYFLALQDKLGASLGLSQVIPHPVGKGDETEINWLEMLESHLPKRYQPIAKCFVVDHLGQCSDEIDIALCDRQYSTMVFSSHARLFVPAESVYAVLEVKPRLSRDHVLYAAEKTLSVRRLERTNAPVFHAGGCIETPKEPGRIIGGLLTSGSDWTPGSHTAFVQALSDQCDGGELDLGCALDREGWEVDYSDSTPTVSKSVSEHALIFFYLRLLARLQNMGTVPAMDLNQWGGFLRTQ